MIAIAKKMIEWRELYGYKQQQVADVMGVRRVTYANYECGRRSPDIGGLIRLAQFYKISLDELIGYHKIDSDRVSLLPWDRQLLNNFHKLSEKMQKGYLAHIKLDVELEAEGNI